MSESPANRPADPAVVSGQREPGRRKSLVGVVVSNKMDKTAVVAVERRERHPLYRKIVRSTKRYKAHDPHNGANLGDVVRIEETRPLSKEKRWRIAETLTLGNVAEVAPREIGIPEELLLPVEEPTAQAPRTAEQPPAAVETPPADAALAAPAEEQAAGRSEDETEDDETSSRAEPA